MKTRPAVLSIFSILILTLFLTLTSVISAYAETTPIKDAFSTYYPSSKILAESDEYLVLSVDYAELSQSQDNEVITVNANPYKFVIVFATQNNQPIICVFIPVNEDGTLPQGGNLADPSNAGGIVLMSPAFLFQNMNLTPTAP